MRYRRSRRVVWRQCYEGIATIAYRSGNAIAGISGPWSGRYVVTWWALQFSDAPVEIFDSMEEAKRWVAQSVRNERPPQVSRALIGLGARRHSGFLAWLRSIFGRRPAAPDSLTAAQVRHQRLCQDLDLTALHFDAYG